MSGVTNVGAPQGAASVPKPHQSNQGNKGKTVPVGQKKETEAYKATKKKIEQAKYNLEVLKVEAKNPSITPAKKKELQAKIDKLENVYRNVTPKIDSDGSVTFDIRASINVEDFKEAFGLADGSL